MSQPQDGGELKRVNSFQWPSGHVNHLTDNQIAALDKFKSFCQSKGYYSPGDDKTPASHDDETLLRYLRARKFIPQDAFGQFKDTEDWRQENKIDTLYETIDVDEYEQTRRLYPQWTGRRDKRGIPFYVFEVSHLDPKEVTAYEKDADRKKKDNKGEVPLVSKVPRKMLRLFALYENLCRFVLPLCSAIPGRPSTETPVSQSSNIVDLGGVSLKQFWNLRAHLQDSSRLATAHYPETLDQIFVVGAPSFFTTIWDYAKRWFDPITVSKITILSDKNTLAELEKFVDVENIPKKYGGKLEWKFGEMPSLEPAIANSLRWKRDVKNEAGFRTLPIGPIMWRYDEDGDLVAVETGSRGGQPRDQVLAGLHPEADVARLALSPGRNPHSQLFAAVSGAGASTITSAGAEKNTTTGGLTAVRTETNTNGTPTSSNDTTKMSTPSESTAPTRQGTSSTKLAQQASTHASDPSLENNTPEVRGSKGDAQHAVMEPGTVGQAPKETPLYRNEDSNGGGSVLSTAQQYASSAMETAKASVPGVGAAMSAVGLSSGEKKETESEEDKEKKKEDPRVDEMESHKVEEFIRAKTQSTEKAEGVAAQKYL